MVRLRSLSGLEPADRLPVAGVAKFIRSAPRFEPVGAISVASVAHSLRGFRGGFRWGIKGRPKRGGNKGGFRGGLRGGCSEGDFLGIILEEHQYHLILEVADMPEKIEALVNLQEQ